MQTQQKYWFPARSHGWGWGFPDRREGWLALAAFAILVIVGLLAFPPITAPASFGAYMISLFAVLIFVCWFKGEPPTWRWGKKDGG